MLLKALKPRLALKKAFLKIKPVRTEIEPFKLHLIQLLDRTSDTESEEFHKNLVFDFIILFREEIKIVNASIESFFICLGGDAYNYLSQFLPDELHFCLKVKLLHSASYSLTDEAWKCVNRNRVAIVLKTSRPA